MATLLLSPKSPQLRPGCFPMQTIHSSLLASAIRPSRPPNTALPWTAWEPSSLAAWLHFSSLLLLRLEFPTAQSTHYPGANKQHFQLFPRSVFVPQKTDCLPIPGFILEAVSDPNIIVRMIPFPGRTFVP